MFRLPVCPHCHTVYHYRDVRKIMSKKEEECYHCKKKFRVSRLGTAALFAIVVVLAVMFNLLILSTMSDILSSTAPIIVTSLLAVVIALIFIPFFISFTNTKK